MRDIAEFVRNGDREGKPEGNYILVELLAAQVLAKAAYNGTRFTGLDEIRQAIFDVAGHPMHNRISGPLTLNTYQFRPRVVDGPTCGVMKAQS